MRQNTMIEMHLKQQTGNDLHGRANQQDDEQSNDKTLR